MKKEDLLLSIALNISLAYLWVFFIYLIIKFICLRNNALLLGVILSSIGTLVIAEVIWRIDPLIKYESNHPVKFVGFVSFGLNAITALYWINF